MDLHYARAGVGPAVLMLHGIGSNHRAFRHQLTGLADVYSVIAWDAPGYGLSADPTEPFTLEDLADRAAQLLEELSINQAHVLGVSLGGVVAQLVYHRHPARVRSLILVDTSAGGGALPEPARSARVRERIEDLERRGARGLAEQRAPRLVSHSAPPALVADVVEIMAEVRPAGYVPAARALGATDLSDRLAAIGVPTLVIHGEDDAVVPLATGRWLAATIPQARLVVIPGAGHVSNQEQPAAFNAAVRSFLNSLELRSEPSAA